MTNSGTIISDYRFGMPLGWHADCDDAVCRECEPAWLDGGYSSWKGFEDWEGPLPIFYDTSADTPTHCSRCGALLLHDLTPDGESYVLNAIAEHVTSDGARHNAQVMRLWWEAYNDTFSAGALRQCVEAAFTITERATA